MLHVENNHNVYVLGAGFSVDRGLPTMANFMFEMRDAYDWHRAQGAISQAKAIESVLEFRLDAASAAYRVSMDLENIEQLFSLADAIGGRLDENIRIAISATIDFCLHKNKEKTYKFTILAKNSGGIPKHWIKPSNDRHFCECECPQYELILWAMLGFGDKERNQNRKTTVVTFNYDCVVEDALKKIGIPYSYGFRKNAFLSSTKLSGGYDETSSMRVLKLHGSVNWASKRSSGKSFVLSSHRRISEESLVPVIIPPTWRKNFSSQMLPVWNETVRAVTEATRLVIIGFSMPETDAHFKYLIGARLKNNVSLRRVQFVNPQGEIVRKRASEIFSDTFFRTSISVSDKSLSDYFFYLSEKGESSRDVGAGVPDWLFNFELDGVSKSNSQLPALSI